MRTGAISIVVLGAAARVAAAQPSEPPAPVVRAVPPGMEKVAAARAQEEVPKPPAYWRSGLTLRVGMGMGTQIAAVGSQIEQSESSTFSFAIGGYPTKRLALFFQFETTNADHSDLTYDNLHFTALAADFFVTDRFVVGAALGQARGKVLSESDGSPYNSYDDRITLGAEGRAAFLLTQRRKHAVDLDGSVITRLFDKTQVTTIEISVAYRFL